MRKKITPKQMKEQINRVKKCLVPTGPIHEAFIAMNELVEMFVEYVEEKLPKE